MWVLQESASILIPNTGSGGGGGVVWKCRGGEGSRVGPTMVDMLLQYLVCVATDTIVGDVQSCSNSAARAEAARHCDRFGDRAGGVQGQDQGG